MKDTEKGVVRANEYYLWTSGVVVKKPEVYAHSREYVHTIAFWENRGYTMLGSNFHGVMKQINIFDVL